MGVPFISIDTPLGLLFNPMIQFGRFAPNRSTVSSVLLDSQGRHFLLRQGPK